MLYNLKKLCRDRWIRVNPVITTNNSVGHFMLLKCCVENTAYTAFNQNQRLFDTSVIGGFLSCLCMFCL